MSCKNNPAMEDAVIREEDGDLTYKRLVYECLTGEKIKRICKNGDWSGRDSCYYFGKPK